MYRQILMILFCVIVMKTIGQTATTNFRLVHDKKIDIVKDDNLIELYYSTDNKSSNRKVTGIFRSITADSITLDMIIVRDNKKITKDITKPGELYQFSVKDIQSLVTVRRKFENSMKAVFLLLLLEH
jgi:hypothetical protein